MNEKKNTLYEKKKYFVRELRETDLMELILRAALLQLYYGKSEGGMLHYSSQMKMNAFRYLVGFRKTNQSMFHLVHNAELEYNTNTNDGGRWVYTTSIGNCRWNEIFSFSISFFFDPFFSYFYISGLWFQVNGLLRVIHARRKWKFGEFLASGKENKIPRREEIFFQDRGEAIKS